jgi:hypothetical protein
MATAWMLTRKDFPAIGLRDHTRNSVKRKGLLNAGRLLLSVASQT